MARRKRNRKHRPGPLESSFRLRPEFTNASKELVLQIDSIRQCTDHGQERGWQLRDHVSCALQFVEGAQGATAHSAIQLLTQRFIEGLSAEFEGRLRVAKDELCKAFGVLEFQDEDMETAKGRVDVAVERALRLHANLLALVPGDVKESSCGIEPRADYTQAV